MGRLSRALKSVARVAKQAAPLVAPGLVAAHDPNVLRSLAPVAGMAFGLPPGATEGLMSRFGGQGAAMAGGDAGEFFGAESVPAAGFAGGLGDLISRAGDFARRYRGIPDLGGLVAESAEEFFEDDYEEDYEEDDYDDYDEEEE